MMLLLRMSLFVLVVVALKVGQQRFGILSRYQISGNVIVLFLISLYLFLLVSEVASRTKSPLDMRKVRTGAFLLSFPVGGVFGVMAAYMGHAVTTDALILNFVEYGAILGVIAALLSGPISKIIKSIRDKTSKCDG